MGYADCFALLAGVLILAICRSPCSEREPVLTAPRIDTGLPVIIVTHIGNRTGAIRKTPLMRVKDGSSYVHIRLTRNTKTALPDEAPKDPAWVHNLRINPDVEIRDEIVVQPMRVHEVQDEAERSRLWKLAVVQSGLRPPQSLGYSGLFPQRPEILNWPECVADDAFFATGL
jgi:deazaflavin-dependent oxidoreductase (nitroreductase family)